MSLILKAKFRYPEFRSSARTSALKTGTPSDSENLTNTPRYLGNGERQDASYYYSVIGSCIRLSFGTKIDDLE